MQLVEQILKIIGEKFILINYDYSSSLVSFCGTQDTLKLMGKIQHFMLFKIRIRVRTKALHEVFTSLCKKTSTRVKMLGGA